MRSSNRMVGVALGALAALSSAKAFAADTPASAGASPSKAAWQHHNVSFTYFGITALYSCDGLESHVRSLLLYLGARKDAKVNARGCPNGPSEPGPSAILEIDFYSLAPADTPDAVPAHWENVEVGPVHPSFMGRGDCELIAEMKDLIFKNFSLHEPSYRADCTPHQVGIDDFNVKGQVLKPLR